MIPKHIVICNKNDDTTIFINKNIYATQSTIEFIANGGLFNPPFYKYR